MNTFRRKRLFRGFSSISKISPNTELVDIELIKTDLLNHFYTVPGERRMRPGFGSIIWNMLFDPFDETTKSAIISDVERIISLEPRVQLSNLDVFEYEQGLRIDIDLFYEPLNAVDTLELEFDRRNSVTSVQSNIAEDLL